MNPTTLAFILHIGGGTLGLVSGTVALFAAKGGRLHRLAGTVFFVSMLVMAVFACWLAVVMPGQFVNLFIGTFTLYLVATAWMTVRRPEKTTGLPEKIALGVILCLSAPFAVLAFQLATGLAPFLKTAVPFKGPVLIAVYGFAFVTILASIADAKVILSGGIAGTPRIARHLWRMCLGLSLATGSAFTNGLPRLLPGPRFFSPILFIPQLLVLALMVFWLIRVRMKNAFRTAQQVS